MFKSIKQAEAVAGPLGKPSKMPGYAYGIPAQRCLIGSILNKLPGSVCAGCYALKGRYLFKNVRDAQERRFASLTDPRWVDAMVYMINKRNCSYFRWHDAGDIQGVWHLEKLADVATKCPATQFWLPTREKRILTQYMTKHGRLPPNLVVRVSGAMIDGDAPKGFANTSTVVTKNAAATCPAYTQGGVCGSCRACWDPAVANVSYPKH